MGEIIQSLTSLQGIFIIILLGYILGSINFFGIKLGASGILMIALVFGHFGFDPTKVKLLSTIGLPLFLAPIGLIAGKTFIPNIKKNGIALFMVAILTCIVGGCIISLSSRVFNIPLELSLGLGSGALTSTAMLGSITALTPESTLPSVGYGIAYLFGIVGCVLFVQIVPKILKADREKENEKLNIIDDKSDEEIIDPTTLINFDKHGLAGVAMAIILGSIIGGIKINAGGGVVSLGAGGGSIIAGIILANFGKLGPINLTFKPDKLGQYRDLGLAFFLLQAGVKAGGGFLQVVGEYGVKLFIAGALMTLVSATFAFLMSYKVFKLPLFAALGVMSGSMTSAPTLGALLDVTKDDKAGNFYAATQPVATVFLVLMPQIIWALFG